MKRRDLIRRAGLGAGTLAISKGLYNTVVGYGHLGMGTNLGTQDLDAVARESLPTLEWRERVIDGTPVRVRSETVRYREGHDWVTVHESNQSPFNRLLPDVRDLVVRDVAFDFLDASTFFDDVDWKAARPATVDLLRGPAVAERSIVEEVTETDPADPNALLSALVTVFRDRTHYDVPRYLAGSVDDNLLPFEADLREPFEPTIDFQTLSSTSGSTGLFCTEYARLANAAVHAVPATEQSTPVFGVTVRDRRHKHVFTGIGTVLRQPQGLLIPLTFLDYTESTAVNDSRLNRLVADPVPGFNGRHRADDIRW